MAGNEAGKGLEAESAAFEGKNPLMLRLHSVSCAAPSEVCSWGRLAGLRGREVISTEGRAVGPRAREKGR